MADIALGKIDELLPGNIAAADGRRAGLKLFFLSFAALFLELMVIRWVPAVIRLVTYYSNLMLISSFLGLGIGAMVARRKKNLFGYFPLLLLIDLLMLVLCQKVTSLPSSATEARFGQSLTAVGNYFVLIAVFGLNALIFVPLGQAIGRLFLLQPPLRAYACDLGGSLCGTVTFGLFSFYYFSPAMGMAIVALIFLFCARGRQRWRNLPLLAIVVFTVPLSTDPSAIWSPYYYVTVREFSAPNEPSIEPPSDIRTMLNPPFYFVAVNNDFYQVHCTLNPSRYSPNAPVFVKYVRSMNSAYRLPYRLHPKADHVCVVGAGGGLDVETALLCGAGAVDAVEIDPALFNLSRKLNASGVYDDPRVSIHINDARAFFQSSLGGYDLLVFGLLDSHTLFSYSNNVRLDGFIYTIESIRKAYSLLKPDGMLSISFIAPRPWVDDKVRGIIQAATGKLPVVYHLGTTEILCVSRSGDLSASAPRLVGECVRSDDVIKPAELPTDDWPYLYLVNRTIPRDYLTVIVSLLVVSVIAVVALRQTDSRIDRASNEGLMEGQVFFLGMGFLLLETKSIGDCSLYFGTTWFVTMIVVSGVLLMVLAANLVATRLRRSSLWIYVLLFAALVVLYLTPREDVLALSFTARFLWAILIVPLPIFFAGLVFSSTFKNAKDSSKLLGANLIGATIGGLLEYLGMAIGTHALMLLVIAAYAASLVFQISSSASSRSKPLTSAAA